MKNIILLLTLFLVSAKGIGQDSLSKPSITKNKYFIHYYPSTLIAGDVALGIEHLYKKRLSHELSVSIKSFKTNIYYYDKGYRLDYLIKYNLYNGKTFRFSANLSSGFKDFYFKDKQIDYYYINDLGPIKNEPYQILIEDRKLTEYGFGLGISLNFKIYKSFFIGGDMTFNFVKRKITYNYKEVIYRNVYHPDPIDIPATYIVDYQRPSISPYLRLKLSYSLSKK